MTHTLLFLLEQDEVRHLCQFLVEVLDVHLIVCHTLHESTELRGCELAWQKIEEHRRVKCRHLLYRPNCLMHNLTMVKSQLWKLVYRNPLCLEPLVQLLHLTVNAQERKVRNGDYSLKMMLKVVVSFEPDGVTRIGKALCTSESLELYHLHLNESCKLFQYPLRSIVEVLVHIDKTTRQLIASSVISRVSICLSNDKCIEFFPVKTKKHAVNRNVWINIVYHDFSL